MEKNRELLLENFDNRELYNKPHIVSWALLLSKTTGGLCRNFIRIFYSIYDVII
jgi:hypothetical protein